MPDLASSNPIWGFTSPGSSKNPFGEDFGGSERDQAPALNSLSSLSAHAGESDLGTGMDTTQAGLGDLGKAGRYFGGLLGGDRSSALESLGPAKDAVTQQFDQIRNMFTETGARGGGRASTVATSPFEEVRQLSNLLGQSRAEAAKGEAGVGEAEANTGIRQEGVGSQLLGMPIQALVQQRGQNYSGQAANVGAAGSAIGSGTGSLIAGLL